MTAPASATGVGRDVVIVGGGPAGSAAGVFAARYGLDALVFDRGKAALARCAFLANYPGFPAGIDVETFTDLLHAHLEEAGAAYVPDTVEAVDRPAGQEGLVVTTQDGREVRTRTVVAAAWYDGSYLRPLDRDGAMFEEHEHHGEVEERLDPDYADRDGRTPVEGLYVAAPNDGRNAQAVVSAGQGAHVARSLIEDRREEQGYPEGALAAHYDWLRPDAEFAGEWGDRDRWREWFANEAGDHDLNAERFEELRERYIDRAFDTNLGDSEIEARSDRGLERLLDVIGQDRVLEALDDERIRAYFAEPKEVWNDE